MSNLDAIKKKLQSKSSEHRPISVPEGVKRKKREEDCPQCKNKSLVGGFCIVCGYELKNQ